MVTKKNTPKLPAAPKRLADVLDEMLSTVTILCQDEADGIKLRYDPAQNRESKVLFIYGDNASGKSLIRRLIGSYVRSEISSTFEHIELSMRTRTGDRMRGAFMYGPATDSDNSSGAVSLGPLNGLFCTTAGREHYTMTSIDEAEVGLSNSYHYALGSYIANRHKGELDALHTHFATVVVTHSPEMANGLIENMGETPHVLALGAYKDVPLEDWLKGLHTRKSVEDLKGLQLLNRERHRAFNAFFGEPD